MAKLDQNLITAAALAIVEDSEHSELTLSAIARVLDVTQPALYYHVDGMDDILRWVGIAVRSQLAGVLADAAIGLSRADAVRSVANAWRTFSQQHPALYKSTEWHPVEGCAELEDAVGKVLAVLAGSLRGFELTDSERANAALALRSTLHGFVSFELGAGNPSPQSADDSFSHVIELLITGVVALAAGTITQIASAS
jgi:AcrR family transcriptional regulator